LAKEEAEDYDSEESDFCGNVNLPTVYKIFIDRIEFDLKSLEVYCQMILSPYKEANYSANNVSFVTKVPDASFHNLAKTIAQNKIPETIFFEEIKDIKVPQTIKEGWFSSTIKISNYYEITFKDDKKVKIPLEIGDRFYLANLNANYPKLHLWWKELVRGKLPKDLELYLKHKKDNKGYGDSELKNTCKRCGKIWYLGADELEQLEGQLTKSATFVKQMGGIGMFSAMFNPMLAAQTTTTMAATSGAIKSQVDELNEKSRCPECQSKNIVRVLVDGNEKIEKVVAPQETNKKEGSSLADELKKLSELKEQGILDEEEFKTAKRKLMES